MLCWTTSFYLSCRMFFIVLLHWMYISILTFAFACYRPYYFPLAALLVLIVILFIAFIFPSRFDQSNFFLLQQLFSLYMHSLTNPTFCLFVCLFVLEKKLIRFRALQKNPPLCSCTHARVILLLSHFFFSSQFRSRISNSNSS